MGFTIGVVKPDATGRLGSLLDLITRSGFAIDEVRVIRLSEDEAREFYAEHAAAPWFGEHIAHVTSADVVFLLVTDGGYMHRTVESFRKLLGATDPRLAAEGTIRREFGTDLPRNAAHGSTDESSASNDLRLFRRFCGARGDSSLVPPRLG